MAQITVQKITDSEAIPKTLLDQIKAVTEAIRGRAFDLFQKRSGNGGGSEIEDWLNAERDIIWSPASEMVEDDKEFQARVAVPGFDAKDIQVSALPNELVIQAETAHTHEGKRENVCYCEFSGERLFRRLPFSSPVDSEKVTASLDKGILQVNAPKAPKSMAASA